jgi:hypothetical protein
MSRTLKVSSSAVGKTIQGYDETGSREDCHREERSRVTSAAEDKFIRVKLTASAIAAQINASQSSSNRHTSTSTVETARIRTSWLIFCKETTTKGHQQ